MYFLDLERTEYSDSIQAVLGRALIIGTRFENLCKSAYRFSIIKDEHIKFSITNDVEVEGKFANFLDEIFEKWVSLCASIKSLQLPENYSEILLNAKDARNELVHSVAIGIEGCIETNYSQSPDNILSEVESLMKNIAKGDFLISEIIAVLNKEETLGSQAEEKYVNDIVNWVVEL